MPDRKAIIPGKCLRIRVAGIVFCQEKLLVVEHGNSARHWACYPGGGLEPGEELPACLKRELNEELGIDCAIQHLSAVGDFIDGGVHSIEFFFRCGNDDRKRITGDHPRSAGIKNATKRFSTGRRVIRIKTNRYVSGERIILVVHAYTENSPGIGTGHAFRFEQGNGEVRRQYPE